MNKEVFKPSAAKIAAWWLLMTLMVLVFFTVLSFSELTDLTAALIAIGSIVVACLLFMLMFYRLPYFRVEISEAEVAGPGPMLGGWQRVKIPLSELDMRKVKCIAGWLGIYSIGSDGYGTINTWALDEKQFARLLTEVKRRQARVQPIPVLD